MKTDASEFLKQAELHPDNIAVLDIQGAITYGRLNSISSYLAEKIPERLGGKDRGRILHAQRSAGRSQRRPGSLDGGRGDILTADEEAKETDKE